MSSRSVRPNVRRALRAGLAALLLAAGCGDGPADFAYRPPDGWRVLELLETGLEYPVAAGPATHGVVPTIAVQRVPLTDDLEAFVDAALADALVARPGFRLLSRRDEERPDGRSAVRVLSEVDDEARTLRVLQVVLAEGDTAFVVTCSRAPGDDARTDAAFEQALASFVAG